MWLLVHLMFSWKSYKLSLWLWILISVCSSDWLFSVTLSPGLSIRSSHPPNLLVRPPRIFFISFLYSSFLTGWFLHFLLPFLCLLFNFSLDLTILPLSSLVILITSVLNSIIWLIACFRFIHFFLCRFVCFFHLIHVSLSSRFDCLPVFVSMPSVDLCVSRSSTGFGRELMQTVSCVGPVVVPLVTWAWCSRGPPCVWWCPLLLGLMAAVMKGGGVCCQADWLRGFGCSYRRWTVWGMTSWGCHLWS